MFNTIEYQQKIDELQKWFEDNENLPKKVDRSLLMRFYQVMHEDMKATRQVIETNYRLRNQYEHIFLARDPHDEDTRLTFAYVDMVTLPGLTPEKYKVSCFRLCDSTPSKVRLAEDTKAFFMLADCQFSQPDYGCLADGDMQLSEGQVQIFDMAGFSLKHSLRLQLKTLKIYLQFLQKAYPARLKAVHAINCPSYLDKILMIVKPLIDKEVYQMIHFHLNGLESLYEFVPREVLPSDYGGSAKSVTELKEDMLKMLDEKRDYLMDPEYWRVKCI